MAREKAGRVDRHSSSMGSQIISKSAEAVPLTQVNWSLIFWSSFNARRLPHFRFFTTPPKPLFQTSPKGLPPNGLLKGFVLTLCLLAMVRNSSFSWRQMKSHSAASVNIDQTSHMEKKTRDFQARSLPLGRFAFFNDPSMKFIRRSSPLPPNTHVGTRTLGITIWSSINTRTQQQQRRLLLESSYPLAITINRTCTLTLHIHTPICIRISTNRIMYTCVDRIRGLQVGLAALRWTLLRFPFALLQPTNSTASLRINNHLCPVFLYQDLCEFRGSLTLTSDMFSKAGVWGNPRPSKTFFWVSVSGGGRGIPGLTKNWELDLNGVPYPTFTIRGDVGGLANSSVILLLPLFILWTTALEPSGEFSCSGIVGNVLEVTSRLLFGKEIIELQDDPSLSLRGERIWSWWCGTFSKIYLMRKSLSSSPSIASYIPMSVDMGDIGGNSESSPSIGLLYCDSYLTKFSCARTSRLDKPIHAARIRPKSEASLRMLKKVSFGSTLKKDVLSGIIVEVRSKNICNSLATRVTSSKRSGCNE